MANDTVITYEQVRKNQIKTVLLILMYVVVIFVLAFTIGYYFDNIVFGGLIGCFIVFVLLPIQVLTGKNVIGSNTKWHEANINDAEEREAYNLVEGLAISAGLSVTPRVYIIPTDVPNAFAGGLSLKNSYVGITKGLLELLDKPETEGVIAHEISHITNRDILVSTVSIYLMSAAIMLGSILYRMNYRGSGVRRSRSSSKNGGSAVAVIVIAGLVLSIFIKVVARLINLAISRKREYMADANAVRICGYSEGLASALTKISGMTPKYSKEQVASLGGDEMMCMYIFNPSHWILPLFSTHPPIEKRIELLKNMY